MIKAAIIMDPIAHIRIADNTSFALLLEAQSREYDNYYIEPQDIWLQDGIVWAKMHRIQVSDNANQWYEMGEAILQPVAELDCVLLRKDPPFDMEYIYLTYMLELATQQGVKVINSPRSVRDANEKLFASWFPQCCPPTIISKNKDLLLEFLQLHQHTIIKPLDGMGGRGIFQLKLGDKNCNALIDNVTNNGNTTIMSQQFLPAIENGDKRIIMIDGNAAPFGLARIPNDHDFRGNLKAGAKGVVFELSERDHWIATQVGATLREKGLSLVGLDVIGDYLTEINVTSPTCVREIEKETQINILSPLFDLIESLCPL